VILLDPTEAWRAFKPNTLLWARCWLENGEELPASCHHVINEKLAPWIATVTEGGTEMRRALLAIVPPIPPREPEPTRAWIMPAIGKTYSMERQGDVAEAVEEPEKPICAGRGGVTHDTADVRHPPPPVTHQKGGVVRFPMPSGTKECEACGRAFKPYRKAAAYCSSRCRQKAYRERLVTPDAAE
jgi:hypothetical protein